MKRRVRGKRPTRKLFSKEQRAFYKQHAPDGLALDDLTLLGPIFVLKLNSRPPALRAQARRPSCGCTPTARASSSSPPSARRAEMFQVAAEARAFLGGLGLDLSGRQQTKTKTALQQFSRNLGTG